MTRVLALHRIHRNPLQRSNVTEHYDADGKYITASATEIVSAGAYFDIDDENELAVLLEVGAARLLSDEEVSLEQLSGAL